MIRYLPKRAGDFDFFHAVRLIHCSRPDLPDIGDSYLVKDDLIRFCQRPFLTFVPTAIDSYEPGVDGQADKMFVYFTGLFGPQGPLPLWLTEYAREREWRHNDRTLTAFLDIFHHRLISLFWKAWAQSQKTVDLDCQSEGRFPKYFGSLIGRGMSSMRHRDAVNDDAKFYYSGRLAPEARNSEGLAAILNDYFTVPAHVETFVGHWLKLPEESICRLGASKETGLLGSNVIAGSSIWDSQLRICIQLGPMKLKDFLRFLPSGKTFKALRDWVLNYLGFEFLWDVRLLLEKSEVPNCTLGQFGQLGYSSWLKSAPFQEDAQITFSPPSH
jgi:type VI secretion system protein ImpH